MRKYNLSEKVILFSRILLNFIKFKRSPHNSISEIEKEQFKKIKKILIYAYNNNQFYREKFDKFGVHPDKINNLEDFRTKVPFTTKDEILANYEKFIPYDLKYKKDKYLIGKSSGSSGEMLTIYHRPIDTYNYILGRYRIFDMVTNYTPFTKVFYVYTSPFPASSVMGFYPSYFVETLNNIHDTKIKILNVNPDILNIYPSHLIELSKIFQEEETKNLKLKAILVGSELSTQKQRDELSKLFNCKVYDEYSSEELGWVAAQCKYLNYHIFEDLNFIEIVNPDSGQLLENGKVGEIVGTNLCNYSMPFIRYKQGDLASINYKKCGCGFNFKVLNNLIGRKNDSFVLNNKVFSSSFLLDLTYNLILKLNLDIIDFCLIQTNKENVIMQIKKGKSFTKSDQKKIINYLSSYFGNNINIEIEVVKELYKTKKGKRNPIISLVEQK